MTAMGARLSAIGRSWWGTGITDHRGQAGAEAVVGGRVGTGVGTSRGKAIGAPHTTCPNPTPVVVG